jgi:phosphatidylglycerophosphate synthase
VTPNQLTLAGHACMWVGALPALLATPPRPLTLALVAFGAFAFNLMDTLDGLYARHTGRTSPLGELFDHGLDPISLGLAALAFGLVMELPAWLVLGSTATVAYLQFLTYLHGYRLGYVILGEIGIIEGLLLLTALCVAASLGAHDWLTRERVGGLSVAGFLAIALIAGALAALVSMRGLARHAAEAAPLLCVDLAIAGWYAFGRVDLAMAGLLIAATTAWQSMVVNAARLRRQAPEWRDVPFAALLAAAVAASLAFDLRAPVQGTLAAGATLYAFTRGARLFVVTFTACRDGSRMEKRRLSGSPSGS